jgi:DNA-binding MarR family transcriptional regulator
LRQDRAEQQRLAMHLYGRAMSIIEPIRVKMWQEAELTTSQLRILFLLRDVPGSTLGEIARQLKVSSPTTTGFIDRLVRSGYVRREEDARDRRFVRHQLTGKGVAIVGEIEREAAELMSEILGRMSDSDLASLIKGLTKLAAAFAQAEARPATPAPTNKDEVRL